MACYGDGRLTHTVAISCRCGFLGGLTLGHLFLSLQQRSSIPHNELMNFEYDSDFKI